MPMPRTWVPPEYQQRDPWADRAVLPGWSASVLLHALLLAAFALSIRSCDRGHSGAALEDFRDVGIYVRDAVHLAENNPETTPSPDSVMEAASQTQPPAPTEAELAALVAPSLDSVPSELLTNPAVDSSRQPSTIGPGAELQSPSLSGSPDLARALQGEPAPGSSRSAGHGETSFFDIKASGSRFVYVVDRSGSMLEYGQIQAARNELLTSLQSLDNAQQFHIIFYNAEIRELSLQGKPPGLVWANDWNRTQAGRFIQGISPELGTNHYPALRKALSYLPEHLFLLTDGADPPMSRREMEEVRKLNRGRIRIHCVEFGLGAPVTGYTSFLMTLAKENGGTYRYLDVTKFASRMR